MLRWLFPITCELCGEEAERSLCPDCLASLQRIPRPICLHCGSPVYGTAPQADCCPACEGLPRPFDFARAPLLNSEQNMELIYRLKYRHAPYIAAALAPAMAEAWEQTIESENFSEATIVPVPITPERKVKRGYNQAALLARALGKLLRRPVVNALTRHSTEQDSQTRLTAARRRKNATLAFSALPAFLSGRRKLPSHIILVDDVFTTGSTARACSKALKNIPGVEAVAVLTLVHVHND